MQIVRFSTCANSTPRIGCVTGDKVFDCVSAAHSSGQLWLANSFYDLRSFLMCAGHAPAAVQYLMQVEPRERHLHALHDVDLLSPFEAGSKIFAHVVNYPGHDVEARVKLPEKPFFFIKSTGSVGKPRDPIVAHAMSQKLDHEVELAVVIGKTGKDIAEADALAYVGGYMVANDVSYRDLQMQEGFPDLRTSYGMNWIQGKGLDGACLLGPWLTTPDSVPDPHALRLTCAVNGAIQSDASTSEMVHKIPALIAEASRSVTLHPGDVLLTGAPTGGALGTGRFLKPGDLVESEITSLGKLANRVVAGQ